MVIVATESRIDQSKAAAVFVHGLLGISPLLVVSRLKKPAIGATAALHYAKVHVENSPESKVWLLPVILPNMVLKLLENQLRVLEVYVDYTKSTHYGLNNDNVAQTRDIMDFWRPNYSTTPYVNGVYSTQQYLDGLKTT